LVQTDDFPAAIEFGQHLLDEDLPAGLEADVRLLLGSAYIRMHDGGRALDHVCRARATFEQIGDDLMAVEALDQEATALFLLADPRALAKSVEALTQCEQLQPPRPALQVRIMLHLASIYSRRGDAQNAIRLLDRGLELSKIEPNVRHIAMIHDSLSLAHQQLGGFSTAVNHAQRASTLYAMDRDVRSLERIENNLGYILLQQGELELARRHLDRALELCDERGLERWSRAYVLCSLTELHLAAEELDQADARLREAIEVAQTYSERLPLAVAHRFLGRLRLRQGDLQAAGLAFTMAIGIFEQLSMPERLRDCHIEYAEALQGLGRLEESIVHWRAAAEAGRQSTASAAESGSVVDELGA
jgi:tetratricopeptide (TPR) repeat protein